jgi:hypothetical protein
MEGYKERKGEKRKEVRNREREREETERERERERTTENTCKLNMYRNKRKNWEHLNLLFTSINLIH